MPAIIIGALLVIPIIIIIVIVVVIRVYKKGRAIDRARCCGCALLWSLYMYTSIYLSVLCANSKCICF